ncbi:hypothetical protein Hanom_Chr16g01488051 [Helianthus anomalus]
MVNRDYVEGLNDPLDLVPIGALLLSGMPVGYLYDTKQAKQGGSTCIGPNCFKVTFSILLSVCGLSPMVCLLLTINEMV